MVMSSVETTIRAMRDDVDGDICSRSRVIDSLLDLRLEAGGRYDLVELIDIALVAVPGKNMVPVDWWREQLDMFELLAINPVEPVA